MTAPTVVILAAGQGTRMRSRTPKVLHELCGRSMVGWVIAAAHAAGAGRIVVVGGPDRALQDHLPSDVELAVQHEPRGTGDAVLAAAEFIDPDTDVLVLSGDVPLITGALVADLAAAHAAHGAAATLATTVLDDPAGYGRIVRGADGDVERVAETKRPGDATAAELQLREVNAGVYAFRGAPLLAALRQVRPDNVQGEYYLPDVVPILRAGGAHVAAHPIEDADQLRGVNDRVELAAAAMLGQRRILEHLMRAGVSVTDPARTTVDVDVEVGADTTLEPGTALRGSTSVGEGSRIGPFTTVIDSRLGSGVVAPHSYLVGCEVHDRVSVGPFAYLRPGAILRDDAKAGTFVEIKGSDIGVGAKVPHLSYIGDADVGEGSNLGAATITANYDGRHKHRTRIGRGVRTGVDTTLVAPVGIGDGAYTGAGSVITEDVPGGALAIGRARQVNREGYAQRRAPAAQATPDAGAPSAAEDGSAS